MTNEQLKSIILNAPDGATHIDSELDYWRALSEDECILMSTQYSTVIGQQYPLRSLSDLREILALRESNEELTQWITAISNGHQQVPDWIKQSAKSLLANQAAKGGEK